jgi:GcrA cell cycle regulator
MTDWTPDMLIAFRDLYRQKPELPFPAIAARMSETFGVALTRNACIGKAHRLGLPMRGRRTGPRKPYTHAKKKEKPKMIKVRVEAPIPPPVDPERPLWAVGGLLIQELREGDCKWPLGPTFARPPFVYCGGPSLLGRSYCKTHTDRSTGKPRT